MTEMNMVQAVNSALDNMLEKDENGALKNHSFSNAPGLKSNHVKVFETANEISPEGHVLMVSSITPLIY